jgi:hypothetical protein
MYKSSLWYDKFQCVSFHWYCVQKQGMVYSCCMMYTKGSLNCFRMCALKTSFLAASLLCLPEL